MNKAFPKKNALNERYRPVNRPALGIREKLYLAEFWEGFKVTNRHFWRNLFARRDTVTIEYPEIKRKYPERYRGRHRLTTRKDGQVRCVACMCCSTACPANCIRIEAAEHDDPSIEKYPASFTIVLLKCIYCGLCAEACPCDAIRLDTGIHPRVFYSRKDAIITKEELMEPSADSISVQGGIFCSRYTPSE